MEDEEAPPTAPPLFATLEELAAATTAAAVVAALDPARKGRAMNLSASALFFSAIDLCARGSSSDPHESLARAFPGRPPCRLSAEMKPPGSSFATCVTSVSAQARAGSYSGSSGAKVYPEESTRPATGGKIEYEGDEKEEDDEEGEQAAKSDDELRTSSSSADV